MLARVLVLAIALAACGDDARVAPDAAMPDAEPDAPPTYPACAEFATTPMMVPAHVVSTIAGADVQSPASCAAMDAPYGAESKGPDRVVPIGGLRAGTTYVVKLSSSSDLAFYVTRGCSTSRGPSAEQCVLFEDASLGGKEVGTFVADASTAFVVVDFYASHVPQSTAFVLDVYEEQCSGDAQCPCVDGRCVECASSFDCTAAEPRCDLATNTCEAGVDACASEDAAEPEDDGPAGATLVDGAAQGSVCNDPASEADFFAFDVAALGDTWDLALAWNGARDLDLEIYDANGSRFGLSYWEQPERVRLTYLPIGRYYARVSAFGGGAEPTAYTLTATRTAGAACASAADCAREYRNQIFRGSCTAGACVKITGAGAIAEGGACDSQSDCAANLSCPSFFFVANADTRATCSRSCTNDTQCDAGDVCTTYLANNFCVAKCTTDDECPTSLDDSPTSGPWYRLRCNVSSGKCAP